jgi:hypothetical protein
MNKKEDKFSWAVVIFLSCGLTALMFFACMINIGVGHGSSLPFKLAFPLPYGLFEFAKIPELGNSSLILVVAGFVQNSVYIFVAVKLRSYFSNFMAYSIVVLIHLVLFVVVNRICE